MKKIAYLTIDDSPSKDMRLKADFLFSKKIPAIWFCTGKAIESNMNDVIYAIKKGFIIGNHSYGHPHFSEIDLSTGEKEIKMTDDIIEHAYKIANIERPVKVFRFPYGDKGDRNSDKKEVLQIFLKELGYTGPNRINITYEIYNKNNLAKDIDWFWTYDIMDWELYRATRIFGYDSIEKIYEKMDQDDPEGWKGLNFPLSEDIILVHDHEATTKEFFLCIDRLISKKIEFRLPVF